MHFLASLSFSSRGMSTGWRAEIKNGQGGGDRRPGERPIRTDGPAVLSAGPRRIGVLLEILEIVSLYGEGFLARDFPPLGQGA